MSKVNNLIEEIVHLHEANVANAKATSVNAIEIGVKLHQLKQSLPHGEFMTVAEKQLKAISIRTCQNYMKLASERLLEERCFQMLEAANPHDGKYATVAYLKEGGREAQFIPAEIYAQAEKELESVDWSKLAVSVKQLVKGINGREITQLYRDYAAIREHQAKVYHPPKKLTVEEEIEAENATAMAFILNLHNVCAEVCMDLEDGQRGIIAVRVPKKELKDIRRQLARTSKLVLAAIKQQGKAKTKAVAKRS